MYVGILGLRARHDRRSAPDLLARHRHWAPVVVLLNLASWVGGVVSTWRFRPDLDVAASAHFKIGSAMMLALFASWLTARWMNQALVRAIHPFFGAAALLLAAAQIFFGLEITP